MPDTIADEMTDLFIDEIKKRKGLKQAWNNIDPDTQQQIKNELKRKIRSQYLGQPTKIQ